LGKATVMVCVARLVELPTGGAAACGAEGACCTPVPPCAHACKTNPAKNPAATNQGENDRKTHIDFMKDSLSC
jgi:hypothetical protein